MGGTVSAVPFLDVVPFSGLLVPIFARRLLSEPLIPTYYHISAHEKKRGLGRAFKISA